MISRTHSAIAGFTVLAAALALTGCAPAGSSGGSGNEIVVGAVTEPEKVADPIVDGSLAGYNYYFAEFDQLARFDPDGKLNPLLATAWEHNADFTQWTFTIRDNAKFQNGDPVLPSDIAFTYNTIKATPSGDPASYMEMFDKAAVGAGNTVVFTLNAPFSAWPSIVTGVSIVPEKVYTALGSAGFAAAPVGSGPFMFDHYTRGVEYVVKRNPNYWGAAPAVEKVTFKTVADADARLNGVQSGSLDVALIAPNQVSAVSGSSSVTVKSNVSNGVTFLGMNSSAGPLANQKVREAIALAIDRNSIVKNVLAGKAKVDNQLIAQSVGGFNPAYPQAVYDPVKAKQLVAESGYTGQAIPFQYATNGRIPLSSEIAQAVQGDLAKVGITVTLNGTDQGSFSQIIYGKKSAQGLYLNTYAPSTMDGDAPVASMFGGQQNDYAMLPATAALVAKTRTVGGQGRIDAYSELFRFNDAQSLLIGLYTPDTNYAVDPKLKWSPRADGMITVDAASFGS
ncbi:ABC transporter substrate-binding protein [Nocardia yamanashiensis]|uniref:ABC transporter substrate-binding protein n=1 Tax=Nocardia yamanashiensis TaxID=209247 RepID=UPI001E61C11D|nr:ABC transporter substrate-binding protein [Nocardia yamanashiensis]UGT38960.1 ABC transporter substrate-binding protein [Nocardia yamanashiensis]